MTRSRPRLAPPSGAPPAEVRAPDGGAWTSARWPGGLPPLPRGVPRRGGALRRRGAGVVRARQPVPPALGAARRAGHDRPRRPGRVARARPGRARLPARAARARPRAVRRRRERERPRMGRRRRRAAADGEASAVWPRVLRLRRPLARAGGHARPARRGARLRGGVRHAHRRARVADGPDPLRGAHLAHPARDRRRPDLHPHAGDDGPDRGDDRRDLRRPAEPRPRRLPPAGRRGLARPDDRQAGQRDARVRRDRPGDPPRRGPARGREVADGLPPRGDRPAPGPADLRRRRCRRGCSSSRARSPTA